MSELTPIKAIEWLLLQSKRLRFGRDNYLDVANLIRQLVQERHDLRKLVTQYERAAAPKPRVRKPHLETPEGTGQWDFPDDHLTQA